MSIREKIKIMDKILSAIPKIIILAVAIIILNTPTNKYSARFVKQ